MTTSTIERTTQSTCANCPYFQDFGESNGRGWCGAFDQMARQQHERTGDCEQEIKALEKESQQQIVPEPEPQPQPAGLAGDSVSSQLQQPTTEAKTEFEQGWLHGQQDAEARLHPIYIEATCDYATGYVEGYNNILNSTQLEQQQQDTKTVEWSVIYDSKWDWYQVWVGDRCCREKATSYEEGEQIAQRYIATNELIKRQNALNSASTSRYPLVFKSVRVIFTTHGYSMNRRYVMHTSLLNHLPQFFYHGSVCVKSEGCYIGLFHLGF